MKSFVVRKIVEAVTVHSLSFPFLTRSGQVPAISEWTMTSGVTRCPSAVWLSWECDLFWARALNAYEDRAELPGST